MYLQDVSAEEADNLVFVVLRQRHMKEAIHLEDQLDRDRMSRIAAARSHVSAQRAQDREILLNAFEQVHGSTLV